MNIENISHSLLLANPWWEKQPIPKQFNPPFSRPQLKKIINYEKLGRIVVIKGPRRTGKTTIMYQYIDALLKKRVNPQAILFASMDDLNLRVNLQQLIDIYQEIVDINSPFKKIYMFIDEIQFLNNWSSMAKIITDRNKSIHLIVSGSSASLLIKSSESLAGRTVEETILPFSIREIIQMEAKQRSSSLSVWLEKQPTPVLSKLCFKPTAARYRPQLEQSVKQYLKRGGFPHLLRVKEQSLWLDLLRTDIIQKAIYKDLAELYGVREPLILEKLFLYLVEATSGIANLSSISVQLKLSREALSQYISYLVNAYLIFSLPKYSRYPKEILKSQEKIHIIDPALTWLVGKVDSDVILESSVVSLLLRQKNSKLYYWRRNYEVDCVIETDNKLIPVEIKNTNRPFRPTEYRGLLNFMEKYSSKSQLGFIIYQGKAEEIKTKNGIIRMLPSWYVLPLL